MTQAYSGAPGGAPRSSFDRLLAAFAAAGVRYRLRGDHAQAECPTHADNHPSLSADYKATQGSVLLHCQAGCNPEDILAALELTYPMLHDDYEDPRAFAARRAREREDERRTGRRVAASPKPRRRHADKPRPALPKGRLPKRLTKVEPRPLGEWSVATTYDYCDTDAVVIHQEIRYQRPIVVVDSETGASAEGTEKRFTQRWPDDKGGWVEKTPAGFVPVLYRLPDLRAWIAEGRPIWLCEGAKDADRFIELEEAATTNPSGAGNFKPQQAAALAGAHVRVVLDHDLAGYRRGIKLGELLTDVASLRFVLPATTGRHEDASDHFDAGHGLEDFVEVTIEDLGLLELVADAEEAALLAGEAAAEATARADRALAAPSKARKEAEERYAARWAAEAGKHLVRAATSMETAAQRGPVDENAQRRLVAAVAACQVAAADAHQVAGAEIPEQLEDYLCESVLKLSADGEGPTTEEDLEQLGELIEHPTSSRLPEPSHRIQSPRRVAFAYEEGGEGRRRRGIYMGNDGRWDRVAPLPYVKARVIRRDGSGRQTGTFYLISLEPDGQPVLVGPDELRSNSWTNTLDLPISQHQEILTAATSALVLHGYDAPAVEATPRMSDDGRVQLPHPDTMPPGYLMVSDLDREGAVEVWRQIITLAAQNPRMALVLGAAAIAPFIAGLRQQPHVMALYGGAQQGKSTTLQAAGSMWGYPGGETGSGVCLSWNATSLSVPAFLGDLGVLPAFMDEIGQAGDMKDSQWHQLISNITQGAARMIRARNKPGVQLGLTWKGIFFSTGNAPMGHDATGRNSGVPRRMVELGAPFTNSKEHGEAIEDLVPLAYGHIGQEILQCHSVETVRPLIGRAATFLGGDFDTPHETAMAEHLAAHLAGAMILDEICQTGDLLTDAALLAAGEFLDDCAPPPHDADRVLGELRDWMGREPGAWPTREQYVVLQQPKSIDGEHLLPQHGFRPELAGYVDDDGTVMVTHDAFQRIVDRLEVSRKIVLPTLYERGLLKVQESRRRRGEWAVQSRVFGGSVYAIRLPEPEIEDDEPHFAGPRRPVGGFDPTPVGGVGGAVGGGDRPLTCGVGGVGGVGGVSSRVDAHAREIHFPDSSGPDSGPVSTPSEVLTKLAELAPCVTCGEPTAWALNGVAVHAGGDCAETMPPSPEGGPATAGRSTTAAAPTPAPAAPAAEASGLDSTPTRPRPAREARFTAPAACLDAEGIHLADGSVRPWPTIGHLGDLALLTGRDQLRLGWGGGEDRLPDQGQVWLYAGALERLGLPPVQPPLPDKALTKAQRAKETAKIFRQLDDHPMVAGALEAGWQLGQGGHLGVWTRIWHSELMPQGAMIVGLPWHRIEGVSLFEDNPEPGELARRLLLFAQRVGVAYRITSAATGLDLIDHHRPPRRSFDDDRGQSRRRVALVRNTAAELPPWRMKTSDQRFAGLEQDFSWWRTWEKVPESEKANLYVHGYDRNASYLVPWRSLELGVEDLIHHVGDTAEWDGKEHPGYYLIDANWEWQWRLPNPGDAAGARVGNGRAWVTVHTLRQLAAFGITPTVHESYTWGVTARYLEGPGIALAEARAALSEAAVHDPGARAVLGSVKALYSATVGKLAEREHYADFHLWRPDWRDHVIGATKTAILHTITKAQEISGASPLVVDRDAVFYASNEPDPIAAWPGDPAKLSAGLGSWKPIGTADLATWGPQFLPKRTGRWHYADAVEALRGGVHE